MNNITRRQIETLTQHIVAVAHTARTRVQLRDAWELSILAGESPRYELEYSQEVKMAALYYAWMTLRSKPTEKLERGAK